MKALRIPTNEIGVWEKAARASRLKRLTEENPRRRKKGTKMIAPPSTLPLVPGGLLHYTYCKKL
ncbi:hypothetical protein BC567DRAFT_218141 [Phyllosticta citribraziliensis]